MRINGQSFSVSTTRYEDLRRLRASAGNCTPLPVFEPVHFPHSTHIWRLLYDVFFCQGICCFLAGGFVLFMAGVFNSYTSASLFIALTDSPLVRRIFRQEPDPQDRFYIHGYLFKFLDVEDDEDIYSYEISRNSFKMTFAIYGIDTDNNCDPSSNLDFVQFIWLHYERFNFAKYCLTLVRRDYPSLPELLCLKYYRAESDGWRDLVHCGSCVARLQNRLRPVTGCRRPHNCNCTICRREPPLLALASNTLFRLILELGQFTHT